MEYKNGTIFSFLLTTVCLLSFLTTSAVFAEDVTQIGRYSTVYNKPTRAQIDPLVAVSQYKFSSSVKTVGQAVQIVLDNTGYQLAPKEQLSSGVKETLTKTLPMTDRVLGPLSVKETLSVLMGEEVFTLVCNPLHRTVNFKINPKFANT